MITKETGCSGAADAPIARQEKWHSVGWDTQVSPGNGLDDLERILIVIHLRPHVATVNIKSHGETWILKMWMKRISSRIIETGEPKYWEHFDQEQNKTSFIRKLIAQIKRLKICQEIYYFPLESIAITNSFAAHAISDSPEHEILLHLLDVQLEFMHLFREIG